MAHYKGPAKEAQRVHHLNKKRELQSEESEVKKMKLMDKLKIDNIDNKFSAEALSSAENNFKTTTSGLMTVSELKFKQRRINKFDSNKSPEKIIENKKKKKHIKPLSFTWEDDSGDEESLPYKNSPTKVTTHNNLLRTDSKIKVNDDSNDKNEESAKMGSTKTNNNQTRRFGKDPHVNTSFLPDRDREKEEKEIRELLAKEWHDQQKMIKDQPIEITYSYWDGSGHRRHIQMKKGSTVYQFLIKCLEDLRHDFSELKNVTADQLVYVKEDIIIPQTNTFYDFLITKARGKSGPLFNFDVRDDVRLVHDATIEKEDSHAGKIVLRSWYERNKHIFPASRWEPFDPAKTYEKYSCHDKK